MEQDTAPMKIKSYFAASVEQAIQEARQELGQEAMLITSRRASPEARHLGAYEVVFGVQASSPAPPRSKARPAQRSTASPDLSSELQNLRTQLEDIKRTLQLGGNQPHAAASSESEELCLELVSLDLARPLAREIVSNALARRDRTPQTESKPLRALAADYIASKIRCAGGSTRTLEPGTVLAFAGPAGAGKTTTLVKIAVREVLARRLPLRIVSVDPDRVATQEKLRVLSGILGAGFTAVITAPELEDAVEQAREKHVVLVDTPGFQKSDRETAKEIAGCLKQFNREELHLVLPASMKRADLMSCVRQYEDFQPDYLLFTKLDETESYGSMLSAALEADKPLSFLTTGQSIPEDIEPASAPRLLANLFSREAVEAVSAA